MFATTLSLIRNWPALRLPPIVKSPVDVSILNFSDVPSVILKSTSVPPLNTKFPEPLVSKFNGTATLVPSDLRVFVLSSDKKFVGGPIKTLLTVGSTLKNGDAFPKVPSTWIAGASNVSALNVYFSVPLLDIQITFVKKV